MGIPLRTLPKTALRLLGRPLLLIGGFAGAGTTVPDTELNAQGVTTVAVRGTVRMTDGSDPEGARAVVRNGATGFVVETEVRRGGFLVQGLEAGGPYTIVVRKIGALAQRRDSVFLTLGEPLVLHVTLEPAAVELDSVLVVAASASPLSCCHGGTATTLSDSLLHRLPTLNRDMYDFLRLIPQLSSRTGLSRGVSAGGVGFRFNDFQTNGVSERSLGGSQPPEFAGGKSLPFEAVREYQALVAPFDVRYGNFSGAMVNAVTRSGTNRFEASGFGFGRSDALARSGGFVDPYEEWQYGASLAGPIYRDHAQFLFASEFQRVSSPMVGPFVGQPAGAGQSVPVAAADLARIQSIHQDYGLESGSGGPLPNRNRLRNLYGRLDAALPGMNSRATVWINDSDAWDEGFSREDSPELFPLSSQAVTGSLGTRTVALQLNTALRRRGGGHNELSLSRRTITLQSVPDVRQPLVQVVVPSTTGGFTTLVTGTPLGAQGGAIKSWDLNLHDDLTLPLGASHVANVGVEVERFRLESGGLGNAFGAWTFLSLDSLQAGQAERFELDRDFGSANVPLTGGQFAAYAGDQWRVGERLVLTLGFRADRLTVSAPAPYNPLVDSLFDRRTDQLPGGAVHLSPRFGFTWQPHDAGRDQVRGGLGIFTGRPPLAWLHFPLQNYGVGIGTLQCGTEPGDLGPPPPFQPDALSPPLTCAGDAGLDTPPAGNVELVDPDLGMARTLRGVLAYERRLPGGMVGTVEGLVTRNLSDFLFVNLNLVGPQSVDRRGRVMYGSIDNTGRAAPALVTTALPGVIEVRNVSRNHSVQVAASLTRQFEGGIAAMASYTWSRVRDVQTPLRIYNPGAVNWASRAISGRHDDLSPGISLNDVPHRVVLAGTWRAPWRKWLTELSLLYVGESGSPFTYLAGGAGRRGDLNADGGLNDPVYVPRSALDVDEILFSGFSADGDNSPAAQEARVQSQRVAFDRFIEATPCLRRQRGRILARNSCREPWAHTTAASVRQMIPIGGRAIELQLDVFNLLNVLDGDWGLRRLSNPVLLQHVGQTAAPSEPVFQFVEGDHGFIDPAESAFQFQFGVRYRF